MFGKFAPSAVRFLKGEDGPTAVEYAVMLALIVVVCIAAITMVGQNANSTFGNIVLNTGIKGGAS
jgi:pilus assembly protein Flp/PilA